MYFEAEDSPPKGGVILYNVSGLKTQVTSKAAYSLPASWRGKAHQGYDGYRLLAESPAQWD